MRQPIHQPPLRIPEPIIYLITSGETTLNATTFTPEVFSNVLELIQAAVTARVPLVQLREKSLSARMLYELTLRAAKLTKGTSTKLLVNDRADIARAGEADGVHLTTKSIEAKVIRQTFGEDFLIGVSTHSLKDAVEARSGGADFATFGPVFETPSKLRYGPPIGLEKLREAASLLDPFPLIALGGISLENTQEVLNAGAKGISAIRLLNNASSLSETVRTLNRRLIGD